MDSNIKRAMERRTDDKNLKHQDIGSPNAHFTLLEKLPFRLQNGEKIIRELKPQFFGFMITRALRGYVTLVALTLFMAVTLIVLSADLSGFLFEIVLLPFILALFIVIISLKPLIQYGKSWYWITNHRVIGKRGFLGYNINSVPLENVADVVLERTLLDRFLGLSSLIIVSMGNAPVVAGTEDEKAESPNFFPALTEATAKELQRVLFNLRDEIKNSATVPIALQQEQAIMPILTPQPESRRGSTQESIQPRRVSSK